MLNIVCVNAGNYEGRGKEYVEVLYDMVSRNLRAGTIGKFICFTDDPDVYRDGIEKRPLTEGLKGWWHKLALFKDGTFENGERVIYFDLDTVIVSGLDDIVTYEGNFAILQDFYRPNGFQSSVMMWQAGTTNYIWSEYKKAKYPDMAGGDQEWIENVTGLKADILQTLYPHCFVSYKVHARANIPTNAKVVVFHGQPRPHDAHGWVDKVWKIGGGSSIELEMISNVHPEQLEKNIRYAITLGLPHIEKLESVVPNGRALLIGGGPSIATYANELSIRQRHGEKIFALNGAYHWLAENEIKADYHIIADARPENADFIDNDSDCTYLIASHCDKAVFDKLVGKKVIIWHRGHDGVQDIVDPGKNKYVAYIAGGSTVGMVGMSIVYALGFRELHLYGYDSSYAHGEGHAYPQPLNDNDRIINVSVYDRDFLSAPWMIAQLNEFIELAPSLIELGCEISTHGDGLLQYMAFQMEKAAIPETDIKEKDGFWWPANDFECKASIDHFVEDADWIMDSCDKFDIVIQAGGNVGIWPKKYAKRFNTVYTFEPDNINFQCLVRNCEEPNIVKLQAGLGDVHSMCGLATMRHNCGAHFVDGNGIYPILRIDDFDLPACDLIQLDIEGFELNALKGAESTIKKYSPVIVIEDKGLSERYGANKGDAGEWLQQFGYIRHAERHRDVIYKNISFV